LQSWDSEIFVLDATAFYQGFPLRVNRKCITTELIVREVSHLMKDLCPINLLIEAKKICVERPKEKTVSYTRSMSTRIGDSKISPSDISVVALAVDHRGTIVSDDHRVCNLSTIMSVPCLQLSSSGIKTLRKWTKYCRVCAKKYSYDENTCLICGSLLRVRFRDKNLASRRFHI
jgi:endoribonuclease Nob1